MLSDDFFFQINYSFTSFPQSGPLGDDPTDYITEIQMDIRKLDEKGNTFQKIGQGQISLIHFGMALDQGFPLFEVMDASASILNMSEELFNIQGEEDLWEKIEEFYDYQPPLNYDVCFIERLELLPEYRGKGRGRWVIKDILERFYGSCGLVVIKAYPLQHESDQGWGEDDEWKKRMQYDKMEKDAEKARYQLYHYYQKLGFVNPFGEEYFIIRPHDFNFEQFDVEEGLQDM